MGFGSGLGSGEWMCRYSARLETTRQMACVLHTHLSHTLFLSLSHAHLQKRPAKRQARLAYAHNTCLHTISRLRKIIGLVCKRALYKRLHSAKETCIFKEVTLVHTQHSYTHNTLTHTTLVHTRFSLTRTTLVHTHLSQHKSDAHFPRKTHTSLLHTHHSEWQSWASN